MDFSLRCNSLKCRVVLTERAVVTTCSHIFCNTCSDSLGLTAPPDGNRMCPACQSLLPNPDDAVSTSLNPTDDYKTSVLSGLAPSTIIECAGRALAFWSYQSTQEIVYQEYLAKTLTEKCNQLNVQMDRLINEANSELGIVNQKLSDMQMENQRLRKDNTDLVTAFREKTRKHQQTQELYDRLKRKEMTAATQSAAFDSVDDVLRGVSNKVGLGSSVNLHHGQSTPQARDQHQFQSFDEDFTGHKQSNVHQRRDSDHSQGSGGMMPPPPLRRPVGHEIHGFHGVNPTSSSHRTRLGPLGHSPSQLPTKIRSSVGTAKRNSPNTTPMQRQPLSNFNTLNASRNIVSGYGMSAGMKVGRQQPSRFVPTNQFIRDDPIGHESARNHEFCLENNPNL